MQCWRSGLLVLLMVPVLSVAAPRPAHALLGLDALFSIAVDTAELIAKTVKTSISSYFDTLEITVLAQTDVKLLEAKLRYRQDLAEKLIEIEAAKKAQIPPQRNVCRQIGRERTSMKAETASQNDSMVMESMASAARNNNDLLAISPDGPYIKQPSRNPASEEVRALSDRAFRECPFETDPAKLKTCRDQIKGPGGRTPDVGTMPNADLLPITSVTYIGSTKELEARLRNIEITSGINTNRVANPFNSPQDMRRETLNNSDIAAQEFAQKPPMEALSRRKPIDNNFDAVATEQLDPCYRDLSETMGWRDVASVPDAKKEFNGKDPTPAQQLLFDKGLKPSAMQLRYCRVAGLMTEKTLAGRTGHLTNSIRNVISAQSNNLSLRWVEYENMERQVLMEAISLARKVRQGQGRL